MARSTLIPKLLSPSEAEEQLPIPCLLVFQGMAQPVFPGRDRGTPSPVVLISRVSSKGTSLDVPYVVLPFPVDWRQWRTAVVPVLEDETWWVNKPLMLDSLSHGGLSSYLRLLGSALRQSFTAAGWGP